MYFDGDFWLMSGNVTGLSDLLARDRLVTLDRTDRVVHELCGRASCVGGATDGATLNPCPRVRGNWGGGSLRLEGDLCAAFDARISGCSMSSEWRFAPSRSTTAGGASARWRGFLASCPTVR